MKLRLSVLAIFTAFLFTNFYISEKTKTDSNAKANQSVISEDVQKIIDNSCIGCHDAASKNEKGRDKLMFESLDTLKVSKLVGKLAKISEEVSEDKMPPAKFLEFKPEAKLTPEQKKLLIKWADMTANSLLKENAR